jgi:thiol-disulfide isomerase/thioredoxin
MRGLSGQLLVGYGCCFLILFLANNRAIAADRQIRGRVVDSANRPVAGAGVSHSWRANGTGRDKNGKWLDLTKEENVRIFWSHLGEMEPIGRPEPVPTGDDGQFSLTMSDSYQVVMAMDPPRQRGGLAFVPAGKVPDDLEIKLGPLVRLRGSFEGPASGQRPYWTHVYVNVPNEPTRPIDITRLVSCGSFDAKFDIRRPAVRYVLEAYSQFADKEFFEGDLIPDREVFLSGDEREMDLGRLKLSPHRIDTSDRKADAKSAGKWGDYHTYYGQALPNWHVTDARGVTKNVQPADFRGKWLLVDFWGFSCRPCMKTGLPKLIKFYEDHAAQRDRFEIVAICLDPDGELKSMADVDRSLDPFVKHVWGGKTLPFPVLLDPSFETWQRYGLDGMGQVMLIDPDGRLIKGDETVLAEKLASP